MQPNLQDLLLSLVRAPDDYNDNWIENACEGVNFLKNCLDHDSVILYANNCPNVLIQSVLVPHRYIYYLDYKKLGEIHLRSDVSWKINYSYDEKGPSNIFLEPPLSNTVIADGEQLVFRRIFHGAEEVDPTIEISQKLIHALDLFFIDEHHAYCRLDQNGEIEKVISIFDNENPDYYKRIKGVSMQRRTLETYMVLTGSSLVTRFDFRRGTTSNGSKHIPREEITDLLYCRSGIVSEQASFAYGCLIYETKLTKEKLISKQRALEDTSTKQYVSFKAYDFKNCRNIETSCGPEHTSNYFHDSNLPYDMSPAFFRSEVLHKYKMDPEKYTIQDRSISCRNIWDLVTYDINEQGQVSTYLKYLSYLPYEEQLYWKSFNKWPKGSISKQAHETDFLGQFPSEEDPLRELKKLIQTLDSESPPWWKRRGEDQIDAVLIPATDSTKEWGDALQELDKLVIEGFKVKELRSLINNLDGEYNMDWGSLKLIETYLNRQGFAEQQAKDLVKALREVHHLRTVVTAHGAASEKDLAIKDARREFEDLRAHFRDLVQRIYDSLAGSKEDNEGTSPSNNRIGIIAHIKEGYRDP